jgi:[acyl-carrier-protein] S-malonyltransferase
MTRVTAVGTLRSAAPPPAPMVGRLRHCFLYKRDTGTIGVVMDKTAFTFPGQGRVAKGSGTPWMDDPAGWPFQRASERLGWDILAVLDSGDAAMTDTRKAQPAIYTHSAACHLLARAEGLRPDLVAGHSLGEYAALFAAGGISFEQGLDLVVHRAELAHQAGGTGVMRVVLGLPDKAVRNLCRTVRRQAGKVFLANSNAPGQVVISGELVAVEEAGRLAMLAGAKRVLPLPIGGGFHTPLMKAAKRPFREAIDRIQLTRLEVPLVSNAKAKVVRSGRRAGRLLARQLTSPVDWTGCVERLRALGTTRYVELGPGKVLEGLIHRIDPRAVVMIASTPDEVRALVASTSR